MRELAIIAKNTKPLKFSTYLLTKENFTDFRLVFLLREVEGCSVEETAAQLDLLPATVKTRLHRARRLLRKALDARLSEVLYDAFPFLGQRCEAITRRVLARLALGRR